MPGQRPDPDPVPAWGGQEEEHQQQVWFQLGLSGLDALQDGSVEKYRMRIVKNVHFVQSKNTSMSRAHIFSGDKVRA